ncbi:hypothetical protein EVAR_99714_1 [Eumeta japonica]|uniref:Uncharacterized protein n=1 Tax=Eumeta variegata TaxID=151549 RepID=A0A4C1ZH42_EUMVA|nr:hypothetical protein EVAR_99714_1 [Eumeta japonica]
MVPDFNLGHALDPNPSFIFDSDSSSVLNSDPCLRRVIARGTPATQSHSTRRESELAMVNHFKESLKILSALELRQLPAYRDMYNNGQHVIKLKASHNKTINGFTTACFNYCARATGLGACATELGVPVLGSILEFES